jgi:metallo-beta-lactamase class B
MYKRLGEDIYIIGGPGYSDDSDAFVYLVDSSTPFIVDSGLGRKTERIIDNILETGIDAGRIKYLVLTHAHIDHTGGAHILKKRLDLEIVAHLLDCEPLISADPIKTAADWYDVDIEPLSIDVKLEGESGTLMGDERVLWYHIPGHTPGSIAIVYQSGEKRVIFGQDVHGPIVKEFGSSREDYIKSLNRLIELKGDILCEGHYGQISGRENVERFIRQFL